MGGLTILTTPEVSPAMAYLVRHSDATTDPVLTDADLESILADSRVLDSEKRIITDPEYVTTYDLVLAVTAAWELKAAKCTGDYDFSDTGLSLHRSDVHKQCLAMVKLWRKKQAGSIRLTNPTAIIANSNPG